MDTRNYNFLSKFSQPREGMSNLEEVRINIPETVTSPPQQLPDNTAAAGNDSSEEKDKNRKSPPPQDLANDQSIDENLIETLYKAALKGDWETARENVFNRDPFKNSEYLTARISEKEGTALHVAVAAESFSFAEKLVRYMKKDDLAIKSIDGDTAFFLVAAHGIVEVAKAMFRKNNDPPGIRGRRVQKMLPIHIAALYGREKMVEFLHGVTKDMTKQDTEKLKEYLGKDLFEEGNSATENELHGNMDDDMTEPPVDDEDIRKQLHKAASRNDWFTAYWKIFGGDRKKIPKYATASLTDNNDNALHIAAAAGSSIFIYFLRKYLSEKDLKMLNAHGNTAFYLAAKYGRFKCAELMLDINKELLELRGDANVLPIQIAAQQGRIKTVKFLYSVHYDATDLRRLSQEDCEKLLPNLICRADLIDVAWKLLKEHPNIVTINIANRRREDETFLHVLAQTHLMSPELSNQNKKGLIQRFLKKEELIQRFFNKWLAEFELAVKSMFDRKITVPHKNKGPHTKLPKQALDLLKQLLDKVNFRDDWMHEVIKIAVRHENVEFLSLIICDYCELMKGDRETAGLIFSNAISKRQKDIFQLRKLLRPSFTRQILDYKDDHENNILHLAGKLSPPEQLYPISGVALQLQQELLWFEEVSNMVDASKAYEKNKDGKTPKALFDEEHKQLKEKGEQWMKDTANSFMIVATLIATVVFAAAFTVPGGTNEESGMPRFSNQLSFRIFVFANAISLVLSVYSLLNFLAIHTSPYAEKDFLMELPRKLVVGLLTLFLSIAAMMVVFCTSIFIVLNVENIWVRILLSVGASLPVLHFAKMKGRHLLDIVRKIWEIKSILKEGKRMKGAY